MKKLGKVFITLFALVSLTIMPCAVSFAAEKQVLVTTDGYTIICEEVDVPSLFSDPDQKAVKYHDVTVYDRNGVKLGVYRATFTGMYSSVDNTSQMTSVTVSKISGSTNYVSWQTHTEYEDGFVTFYVLGEYAATLTGHISYNGNITFNLN